MWIRTTAVGLGIVVLAAACGTSVFSLPVGTCFDDPDEFSDEIGSVDTVDCAQPHDNEVYSSVDYAATSEYPGEQAMIQYADESCLPLFEAYVDRDYETSALDYAYLYPTQSSWDQADDREIICFLYDFELAKLTGSMEGSGI